MTWHREIWTYLIVTLVTVLIWAWAASETREHKIIPAARIQFVVSDAANWNITPAAITLSLNVEGTKLSVQKLTDLLRQPAKITVPANVGHLSIDLAEALRGNDDVRKTGATMVSSDPPLVDIDLDQIDRIQVPVKANLPGVTPEGEITVQPREVSVSLPHALRQRLPQDFAVEAFIDRRELDLLTPGAPQSQEVRLRLPETLSAGSEVRMNPSKVKVNFTIRSRIRETVIDSVRVQIAGPPEDRDTYRVEIDPKVLRGVMLMADADLSRQIESGEVPVIALLQLSSREKEAMIDHKAVSCFLALVPETNGGTRYEQLGMKPGAETPVISLKITNRAQETPPTP